MTAKPFPPEPGDHFLADEMSQLLALADALDSQDAAMISAAFAEVLRTRGLESLAVAGGLQRLQLRDAIRDLQPPQRILLRQLVSRLVAGLRDQAADRNTLRGP